ncbi:MAG: IS66 family transposase [Legionellaceae bacterium]
MFTTSELEAKYEVITAENSKLVALVSELKAQNETLQHHLYLMRHARFGRKSEKDIVAEQLSLQFDEADDTTLALEATETSESETITYTRSKKGQGRHKLPESLPYIEKIHDLCEAEKQCACGCTLTHIGEERSEQLDVIPQMTFRVVHIRKKYACKQCEETIQLAKFPKQPLPKSMASAGLLAAVIDAKFNRHMPLYRQEDMFKRAGIPMTRATLSHWMIKSADLLMPLVKLMEDIIQNHDIAYADETPLQVLKEKGQKATSKSYMWLFMGGPPDKRSFIYTYAPSRANHIALDFFEDFRGYLHADCYSAYVALGKSGPVTHVACMAHARRYFVEVTRLTKKKKGLAFQIVEHIAKLYSLEKTLKEENATPEHIKHIRETQAVPILEQIKKLLDDNVIKVPSQGPLAKAVNYMLNHWDALNHYLKDGRLEIDNNRAERAIKPFVIGRKNWLFHGNDIGARAGGILFSMIETCKEHHVDTFSWLKHTLNHIQEADTVEKLEQLLPFNVKPEHLEAARSMPELIFPDKKADN